MEIAIITTVYLIGCILSYTRVMAATYEINEELIKYTDLEPDYVFILLISMFSWFGFMAGAIAYVTNREKYFLKFSHKPLYEKRKEIKNNHHE